MPQQAERRPSAQCASSSTSSDRPLLADARQQVGDRGVQAVADRVRVGVDGSPPPSREQARELAAGRPSAAPQLAGVDDAHEVVERLDEAPLGARTTASQAP